MFYINPFFSKVKGTNCTDFTMPAYALGNLYNSVTGQNDINGIERKHVKQFVVIGRKIRSYVYNSFVGYRYDAAGFSGSGEVCDWGVFPDILAGSMLR